MNNIEVVSKLLSDYNQIEVEFNIGNRGDGVINEGAKELLRLLNINIGKSEVLLFIGAGAFAKSYNFNTVRVKQLFSRYKKIFIASATFDTADTKVKAFLENLPPHIHIICRDRESFHQVSGYTSQVSLSDDFAFYFNYEPYKKKGSGILNAFRGDHEKNTIKEINDVSLGGEWDWEDFVKEIAKYKVIRTNRLHVAIVGTMLDKEVVLYPNSYHKNKSVYEYSLFRYPNCSFNECDARIMREIDKEKRINEKLSSKKIKYVCVGNAKTGTCSLQDAFNKLGFKADGYHSELLERYLHGGEWEIFHRVDRFDFVKDHPYRELYKEIDKKYKCKFILTIRDEKKWVKSYRNTILNQRYNSIQYNLNNALRKKVYGIDNVLEQTDEFLIENIYRKNNQDVLEYFKDRPEDLLIINLTEPNQWDKLCKFLGKEIPDIEFPHSNKTIY